VAGSLLIRAVLLVPLLPFLRYAGADLLYHFRGRKPGIAENVVHVVLGLFQGGLVINAFRLDLVRIAVSTLGIAAFGALDELGFHRGLPEKESDLHAKSHIALFAFAATAVALCVLPGKVP
jgi:hypothetical protein